MFSLPGHLLPYHHPVPVSRQTLVEGPRRPKEGAPLLLCAAPSVALVLSFRGGATLHVAPASTTLDAVRAILTALLAVLAAQGS